jgi:glycosyltransferase involved in cell wall biosynthesis
MRRAAIVSFRFGPTDGVSVEARKWAQALDALDFEVQWLSEAQLPGLGIDAPEPIDAADVAAAIEGCDLIVVENLLSLPLNMRALEAVAGACRGRPTIVRHHDLPWQRARFAGSPAPPTDPAWAHVTISALSQRELAMYGIEATTMYNRFALPRESSFRRDDVPHPLVLHPTRAIARKNVPAAVALAEDLAGTYWLLGPAEDVYAEELARVLGAARCEVRRGLGEGVTIDDAYAACDVVAFPSTWEGFGNPTIESALARRPLAIGSYPVADELRAFGLRWFSPDDVDGLRAFVASPDEDLLAHNEAVAREHFLIDDLPAELAKVVERVMP